MSEPSSFADFLTDWELLLSAVQSHGSELPDLSPYVESLSELLQEGRDLGARQQASRAQLALDAKRRRDLMPEGRAAASRLRAAVKAFYGGHNERLVEFGVRPLRQHRSTPAEAPPPPVGPPPEIAAPSTPE